MSSSERCVSCSASQPKYRCAACKAKYCSLPCYKLHQESGCSSASTYVPSTTPATATTTASAANQTAPSTNATISALVAWKKDGRDEMVSSAALEQLATTPAILNALSHSHLRQLLQQIDSALTDEERTARLEQYRQQPDFEQFIQQVLNVIDGPPPQS